MKLGFIGDVHAEDQYLLQAVAHLKSKQVDSIYCVGDIADGRGSTSECCKVLLSEEIQTVRGNHDRWIFEGRDDLTPLSSLDFQSQEFLKELPVTLNIETDIGDIHLCHGYGENDMASIAPDDSGYALENMLELYPLIENPKISFIVNGHSHKRMVRKFRGLTIINVGTLFHEHNPCFALFDTKSQKLNFYDFIEDRIEASLSYDLLNIPDERDL